MTKPFVGATLKDIELEVLKSILEQYSDEHTHCFLRWPDKIEFLEYKKVAQQVGSGQFAQEGRIFNQECELRWRCQDKAYKVLLLSNTGEKGGKDNIIESLGGEWETKYLDASFYPKTEARFPKQKDYPDDLNIGQRYFIDAQTACVQFVALTLQKK